MKRKYKITRSKPQTPTSSLPDIIFMLLFFFMTAMTLKTKPVDVEQHLPQAEELKKSENKNLTTYIHIGAPKDKLKYGAEPLIQLDGHLASPEDVGPYILKKQARIPEYQIPQMTVALKVDDDAAMGLVSDVQQELRKVNARKIIYVAAPKGKTSDQARRKPL